MSSLRTTLADPSIGAELLFDRADLLLLWALIVYRRLPSMAPITSR
jgi:hypothetical protein